MEKPRYQEWGITERISPGETAIFLGQHGDKDLWAVKRANSEIVWLSVLAESHGVAKGKQYSYCGFTTRMQPLPGDLGEAARRYLAYCKK